MPKNNDDNWRTKQKRKLVERSSESNDDEPQKQELEAVTDSVARAAKMMRYVIAFTTITALASVGSFALYLRIPNKQIISDNSVKPAAGQANPEPVEQPVVSTSVVVVPPSTNSEAENSHSLPAAEERIPKPANAPVAQPRVKPELESALKLAAKDGRATKEATKATPVAPSSIFKIPTKSPNSPAAPTVATTSANTSSKPSGGGIFKIPSNPNPASTTASLAPKTPGVIAPSSSIFKPPKTSGSTASSLASPGPPVAGISIFKPKPKSNSPGQIPFIPSVLGSPVIFSGGSGKNSISSFGSTSHTGGSFGNPIPIILPQGKSFSGGFASNGFSPVVVPPRLGSPVFSFPPSSIMPSGPLNTNIFAKPVNPIPNSTGPLWNALQNLLWTSIQNKVNSGIGNVAPPLVFSAANLNGRTFEHKPLLGQPSIISFSNSGYQLTNPTSLTNPTQVGTFAVKSAPSAIKFSPIQPTSAKPASFFPVSNFFKNSNGLMTFTVGGKQWNEKPLVSNPGVSNSGSPGTAVPASQNVAVPVSNSSLGGLVFVRTVGATKFRLNLIKPDRFALVRSSPPTEMEITEGGFKATSNSIQFTLNSGTTWAFGNQWPITSFQKTPQGHVINLDAHLWNEEPAGAANPIGKVVASQAALAGTSGKAFVLDNGKERQRLEFLANGILRYKIENVPNPISFKGTLYLVTANDISPGFDSAPAGPTGLPGSWRFRNFQMNADGRLSIEIDNTSFNPNATTPVNLKVKSVTLKPGTSFSLPVGFQVWNELP